jgi:hypothetical protein
MSSFAEPTAGAAAAAAKASPAAAPATSTGYIAPAEATGGTGWITFSGVMLIIAGFLNLVDGLWALDLSDSPAISDEVEDMLWYVDRLETWGWIYTIAGIVLILVGVGVLTRNRWARWIGIAAAAGSMIVNMMWVFVYPTPALIHVLLAGMVVYGLTAYAWPDRSAGSAESAGPAGSDAEGAW